MSARPDTWMPMYWGDYARDTGHLNAAGHGAYLMLIKHYWCTGTPLNDDDDELWRIACCDSKQEWLKLRTRIVRLFKLEDGKLWHKRIDKELNGALTAVSAKAEAGRKGAQKRWQSSANANGKEMAGGIADDGTPTTDPPISHRQTDTPSPSPSPKEVNLASSGSNYAREGTDHPANGDGPNRWDDAAIVPCEAKNDPKNPDRPMVNGFFLDWTFDQAMEAARIDPIRSRATWKPIVEWLKDGIEPATIIAAIERRAEQDGYQPPGTLAYFDKPVRHARAA